MPSRSTNIDAKFSQTCKCQPVVFDIKLLCSAGSLVGAELSGGDVPGDSTTPIDAVSPIDAGSSAVANEDSPVP